MEIRIDTRQFEQRIKELGANFDQLPFVLSQLINNAAFNARRVLVETTWPSHVQQRNKGFIGAALRVQTSNKSNLTAIIYDVLDNRGHLYEHAWGGTERPFRARLFAVPMPGTVDRGAHGIVPRDRPSAIIAKTPKRALRVTSRGIFIGQGGRLHLIYSLRPQLQQPADVPFYQDFADAVTTDMRTGFDEKMKAAMLSRRG
jgi:hypothetical protein